MKTNMNSKKVIVLDTSAFIAGFDPFAVDGDLYSVPTVEKELVKDSLPRLRFEASVERRKLRVFEPDATYVSMVKESSKDVGDINSLSDVDVKILALAIQLKEEGLKPAIVTDDYSIQNVAKKLGLSFKPLLTYGIRFFLHWQIYCPSCHRRYPPDHKFDQCEICGTNLKRKPLRKTQIKKTRSNTAIYPPNTNP
ncbi:MAG: NOB1 family endonuclease [Candidatus Bathyarchaeia archaeon]